LESSSFFYFFQKTADENHRMFEIYQKQHLPEVKY